MSMALEGKSEIDQLLEEFRKIGRDSEYCPESEGMAAKEIFHQSQLEFYNEHFVTVCTQWFSFVQGLSQRAKPVACSKAIQDGYSICTFCRKNGELYHFYTGHRLRDESNRICCPVLRHFVCPICRATGDNAHTEQYCPYNKQPHGIPLITRLKGLRNSMGKRRGRLGY